MFFGYISVEKQIFFSVSVKRYRYPKK